MSNLDKIILRNKIRDISFTTIYLLIVFAFAYLSNKWFEMLIFILAYTLIRFEFSKAIHGTDFTSSSYKGIIYCRYITFIVQILSLIFIKNINISKYINLILAFILGIINFFAKDYLEYIVLVKHYESKIKEFNTRPLESLSIEEMKRLMPSVKYDRLEIVYNFLHKPKEMKLDIFLYKNYVSKATLYRYISEVQDKYKEIKGDN